MSDYQPSIGIPPPQSPPMPGEAGPYFNVAPPQNVQQNFQPAVTNGPTFQVQQPTFQVQQPTFQFAPNAAHVPAPTIQPVTGNILKLEIYSNKSFIVRGVQNAKATIGYRASLKAVGGTFIRPEDKPHGWCFQNVNYVAAKSIVEGANNGTIQPQAQTYQPYQQQQQNYQQQHAANLYAHLYPQQQTQQPAINFNLTPSPAVSVPVTPATTATNPNQQIVSWTMRKPVVNDKVTLVYEDGSAGEEYTVEVVDTVSNMVNNIVTAAVLDPGHDGNKMMVIINGQWQIREDNKKHTLQFK